MGGRQVFTLRVCMILVVGALLLLSSLLSNNAYAQSLGISVEGITTDSGTVRLIWIASGDDGNVGLASVYDIRYSTDSAIVDAWNTATQVLDAPIPDIAGTLQEYTITLPVGTYFFAMKTGDEVPNWSPRSNIPRADIFLTVSVLPPTLVRWE